MYKMISKTRLARMVLRLLIVFAMLSMPNPSLAGLWTVTIRNPTNDFCYFVIEYFGGNVQFPVSSGQTVDFNLPGLHCPAAISGYCNIQGTVAQNIQRKNMYDACANTGWSTPVVCANSVWRVCNNPCKIGTGDAVYSVCKE